ncbi:hypothetical protein L593_11015 [Salinarchaeum sp. Harcht-Bsk1]|uniref:hypothetical protein n=1 Tax=Salinarchaeum sp. Harcht-Bsk1 TaxID=1333523 RepID=UPI0003423A8F|nr:hypothetical protein [Salinarchaeum sp. Harcht-Bsk1]AGN02148.1 hypothetical protein L593_11015 [Salinarchaeum sp. Harcht-Bsk1]
MVESVLLAGAFAALLLHPVVIYGLYRLLTPTPETASTDRERMVAGAERDRHRERRIPGGNND